MTKIRVIITYLLLFAIPNAYANEINEVGGSVEAIVNGKTIYFPALKTDIQADIQGDIATITVTQTFDNPTNIPLNAKYLFPLNKDAAVYGMTMQVGDEIVEAKINRIEKAKRIFNKAKKQGKAAALLVQHRPNMFTQNIANLMPSLPITVTLKYVQTVPRIDGDYELVVPLIVGPRYQPLGSGEAPDIIDDGVTVGKGEIRSDTQFGKWEIEKLPSYPDVANLTIPDTIDKERVSININLESGVSIAHAYSKTHNLDIRGDKTYKNITLADGRIIDNADFVLRYGLSGDNTQSGFLTHKDERGGFFSMLVEPPAKPKEKDITPREMVFILDTSGSMSGQPIAASKVFMNHALNNLRSTDYFRIIQFNNNASEFTARPVLATPANIASGLRYVEGLHANGGTEMNSAIDKAFSVESKEGTLRIVTFLTDGYIGNEASILGNAHEKVGNARIFAFGVGTSVNRYLLSELARAGRGFVRYIDPTEDPDEVARELATKLESPLLTDISIDWGDIDAKDVVPAIIPDLFAGDSIRIQGKFNATGSHIVTLNGLVNGRKASMPMKIILGKSSGEAIPLIWARTQIAEYMRMFNTPDHIKKNGFDNDQLKKEVIDLGLDYSLSTKWTSFVAVSKKIVNQNPNSTKNVNIPLPIVKGITAKAYGNFSGGATPEPATLAGLMILGLAGAAAKKRKRG